MGEIAVFYIYDMFTLCLDGSLQRCIMYVMALERAVPVSIEVKRPSPMLNEIICAPGAKPFFSGAGSLVSLPPKCADAIDATCVP